MAGTQDNGTIRFTGSTVWDHIADGDGGDCGVNQPNPNVVYHSFYGVSLERSNNKGNTWTWLAPPQRRVAVLPAGRSVRVNGNDRSPRSAWLPEPVCSHGRPLRLPSLPTSLRLPCETSTPTRC